MKKINDERIANASAKLSAKMFWVISALIAISLAIKLIYKLNIQLFCLEILCLFISFGYIGISKLKKGILFIKNSDDAIQEIHNSILSRGFMIDFWIIIIGELVLFLTDFEHIKWYAPYLLIWGIPALILTIASVRNGWLLWGSRKRQKNGKKSLIHRVIIASVFYGIIVGGPALYYDGCFHTDGIKFVLGMSVSWGVIFYFGFKFLIDLGEKRATKQLGSDTDGIEK